MLTSLILSSQPLGPPSTEIPTAIEPVEHTQTTSSPSSLSIKGIFFSCFHVKLFLNDPMAYEGKEIIRHNEQIDNATVSTELQIVRLLPSVSWTIYPSQKTFLGTSTTINWAISKG
jgi:hypothetical protein